MTGSVDTLKSTISQHGGLARPNNFLVELPPLGGISSRQMNVLCRSASLPGKQILTHDKRVGMEFEKIAYGYAVEDVSLTFLMLNDYSAREYFDAWRELILNEDAQTVNYKKDYAKRIVIHQLANSIPSIFASASINVGPFSAGIRGGIGFPLGGRLDITTSIYSVELIDAFPTTIGEIQFNNDQDGFIEMTVQLSYTNWKKVQAGQKQFTFTL
jgi:hypothetical protein